MSAFHLKQLIWCFFLMSFLFLFLSFLSENILLIYPWCLIRYSQNICNLVLVIFSFRHFLWIAHCRRIHLIVRLKYVFQISWFFIIEVYRPLEFNNSDVYFKDTSDESDTEKQTVVETDLVSEELPDADTTNATENTKQTSGTLINIFLWDVVALQLKWKYEKGNVAWMLHLIHW